ncbi:MAG: glycosyltransferase family 4 protein, partial [Flavobacteriales bacterium]
MKGKGASSYLKAAKELRKYLKDHPTDIIHAHFALCGFVSWLAHRQEKLVISFMGSDVLGINSSDGQFTWAGKIYAWFNRTFHRLTFDYIIVKSEEMKKDLRYSEVLVIPNGVNDDQFFPMDRKSAQHILNWNPNKLNILFPSDPERKEKNFALLEEALNKCFNFDFEVHILKEISFSELNFYYNAADLVCLTSNREGSPNAIKEAMACNKIIVSTKVGDVPWLFEGVEGLFLAEKDSDSIARAISIAISFGRENQMTSKGRDQIGRLGITSRQIANQLIG